MNRGKFLVVCGSNNSGKSGQVKKLSEWLAEQGKEVITIKYPIYESDTGRLINSILRPAPGEVPMEVTDEVFQWMYAQNRAYFDPELEKLLDDGYWVVGEDHTITGKAWGLTKGVSREWLEKANEGLMIPDWTVLVESEERFTSGIEKGHRHEGAGDEIWQKNQEIHHMLAVEYGYPIVTVEKDKADEAHIKIVEKLLESGLL